MHNGYPCEWVCYSLCKLANAYSYRIHMLLHLLGRYAKSHCRRLLRHKPYIPWDYRNRLRAKSPTTFSRSQSIRTSAASNQNDRFCHHNCTGNYYQNMRRSRRWCTHSFRYRGQCALDIQMKNYNHRIFSNDVLNRIHICQRNDEKCCCRCNWLRNQGICWDFDKRRGVLSWCKIYHNRDIPTNDIQNHIYFFYWGGW